MRGHFAVRKIENSGFGQYVALLDPSMRWDRACVGKDHSLHIIMEREEDDTFLQAANFEIFHNLSQLTAMRLLWVKPWTTVAITPHALIAVLRSIQYPTDLAV